MNKSLPIATIRQNEIIDYLHKHPELIENKKMHELLVGWLLVQFLSKEERQEMFVGFPLKPDWKFNSENSPLTLQTILKYHDKILEDRDIDIYVGRNSLWLRCQITGFIIHPKSKMKRHLIDLIAQKCIKTAPDKNLILIINVESKPNITMDELRTLPKIPFGQIIIIGKASSKRGHFSVCQLYPKPKIGKEIYVPLPV